MVVRIMRSRDLKCYLCGELVGRLVRLVSPTADPRPSLELNPVGPGGLRFRGNRLVCPFCGGSLYLDTVDEQLVEMQREYPRERRGRPPGKRRREAGGG
jgi:hypothetical protein